MNKLISIGYTGVKKCYLNIDEDVCIDRYCKSENITREYFENDSDISVDTVSFNNEFGCYSIWEDEDDIEYTDKKVEQISNLVEELILLEQETLVLENRTFNKEKQLNELLENKKVLIISNITNTKHKKVTTNTPLIGEYADYVLETTEMGGKRSSIRSCSVISGKLQIQLKNGMYVELKDIAILE